LLNGGADPFAVKKLAGQSDVRLTTKTYDQVQAEALRVFLCIILFCCSPMTLWGYFVRTDS